MNDVDMLADRTGRASDAHHRHHRAVHRAAGCAIDPVPVEDRHSECGGRRSDRRGAGADRAGLLQYRRASSGRGCAMRCCWCSSPPSGFRQSLRRCGRAASRLLILCLVTVLVLVAQNVGGAALGGGSGARIRPMACWPGRCRSWAGRARRWPGPASWKPKGWPMRHRRGRGLDAGDRCGRAGGGAGHRLDHPPPQAAQRSAARRRDLCGSRARRHRRPRRGHIERLLASVLVIAAAVFMGEKINEFGAWRGHGPAGLPVGHDRGRGHHQPVRPVPLQARLRSDREGRCGGAAAVPCHRADGDAADFGRADHRAAGAQRRDPDHA